jgi:RNA polymerase sigma-70 factor (ECF subfamily)
MTTTVVGVSPAPNLAGTADEELVTRLRNGDEAAFREMVSGWSPAMLNLARQYVSTRASAEEVVEEAWLGVLRGLDRFQGRSSFKTWVFRILVNISKSRGVRESRSVPFSAVSLGDDESSPAVDADRFRGPDDQWPGHWTDAGQPRPFDVDPPTGVLRREVREQLSRAIDELSPRQGTVLVLRDVQGHSAGEVCRLMEISTENQRVLLHRARSRMRQALEDCQALCVATSRPANSGVSHSPVLPIKNKATQRGSAK